MAEAEAEWELCKENIQPLRRGRAISALTEALSLQQEGSRAITQRQQAFEKELRMYDGDDPLDVWDRYIEWTEQNFPQGGKESNFSVLLERAVTKFTEEKKYYNDARYVDLWVKFADRCHEPLDVFRYMQAQGIGIMSAAFYIAWAEEYEKRGHCRNADSIFQDGLNCGAEPRDRLKQFHKALQARVTRQVMSGMEQDGEDDDDMDLEGPNRRTLGELKALEKKKAVAPINRASSVSTNPSRGLQLKGPLAPIKNSRLMVFDENAVAAGSQDPKLESWLAPPTAKSKENEQKAEKWTKAKLSKKTHAGMPVVMPAPAKPTFQPFVEESEQPPAVTPCKINPSVNSVLSARKALHDETPLKRFQDWQARQQQHWEEVAQGSGAEGKTREQSMYCKDLLFSGVTEFCFEELRAERYRLRVAQGAAGESSSGDQSSGKAAAESCCARTSSSSDSIL